MNQSEKEIRVIILSNRKRKEFFFSNDHCQGVMEDSTIGEDWVPVSSYLPHNVVPREGLEDGIIQTIDDVIKIFYSGFHEIPNPDEKYRVEGLNRI
tara:strand:- start:5483 stop:5770 length:288 start_codon:yes stop_codon:yes gene_type:complete